MFYTLLRAYRQSLGLTQEGLAQQLGMSKSSLGAYERCQRKRYLPYLQRLAAHARRPLEVFVRRLLAAAPPSDRLLLRGELERQQRIEQLEGRKAEARVQVRQGRLRHCQQRLRGVLAHMRALRAQGWEVDFSAQALQCDPQLDLARLDVLRRDLLCAEQRHRHDRGRQQQQAAAHVQGALCWQRALRVKEMREAA